MLNAVLYFLSMKHRDVSDLKFLEIGASYGYLLHSLHKMGARKFWELNRVKKVSTEARNIPCQ